MPPFPRKNSLGGSFFVRSMRPLALHTFRGPFLGSRPFELTERGEETEREAQREPKIERNIGIDGVREKGRKQGEEEGGGQRERRGERERQREKQGKRGGERGREGERESPETEIIIIIIIIIITCHVTKIGESHIEREPPIEPRREHRDRERENGQRGNPETERTEGVRGGGTFVRQRREETTLACVFLRWW